MLSDLVRTVVQRVLRDKILLGLLIVAILGVWVGGMTMGDDKPDDKKQSSAEKASGQTVQAAVAPKTAAEFITWWLTGAMDFNPATAAQSHQQAVLWMSPEVARQFLAAYWPAQVEQAVCSGRLGVGLQPTTIAPQAVNPDGTVVVGVAGTMMVQGAGQQPASQPFAALFLVRQEKDGLRIAGIDPKAGLLSQ